MSGEPYLLDLSSANTVLAAIQEVCRFRKWDLIAAHVRTNHVHLIVVGPREPDRAVAQFKAYSARAAVALATDYVISRQGEINGVGARDSAVSL